MIVENMTQEDDVFIFHYRNNQSNSVEQNSCRVELG